MTDDGDQRAIMNLKIPVSSGYGEVRNVPVDPGFKKTDTIIFVCGCLFGGGLVFFAIKKGFYKLGL